MSNTNTNSRFISEKDIQNTSQEAYDPRTLYERLQEQKQLKEEAHTESRRLVNQIRSLNREETEFLDTVEQQGLEKSREQKQKEAREVAEFKQLQRSKEENNKPYMRVKKPQKSKLKDKTIQKMKVVVKKAVKKDPLNELVAQYASSSESD